MLILVYHGGPLVEASRIINHLFFNHTNSIKPEAAQVDEVNFKLQLYPKYLAVCIKIFLIQRWQLRTINILQNWPDETWQVSCKENCYSKSL